MFIVAHYAVHESRDCIKFKIIAICDTQADLDATLQQAFDKHAKHNNFEEECVEAIMAPINAKFDIYYVKMSMDETWHVYDIPKHTKIDLDGMDPIAIYSVKTISIDGIVL